MPSERRLWFCCTYIYIYIGVIPRNLSSPLLVIYSSFGFKTDFIMWRISREKHIKAAVPFSALRRPDVYINTAELPEESSVCQSSSPWLKSEHTAVTLRSRASVWPQKNTKGDQKCAICDIYETENIIYLLKNPNQSKDVRGFWVSLYLRTLTGWWLMTVLIIELW